MYTLGIELLSQTPATHFLMTGISDGGADSETWNLKLAATRQIDLCSAFVKLEYLNLGSMVNRGRKCGILESFIEFIIEWQS